MADQEPTVRDLIRRVRQGDIRAAEILVQDYAEEIRAEVRLRLRDPQVRRVVDSVDICQSVLASFFLRVAVGQYDIESPKALLRLLLRMARSKVAEQYRRHYAARRDQRRTVSLDDVHDGEGPFAADSEPQRTVTLRDTLEQLRDRLRPAERRVADLRGTGMTWNEVAAQLDETPEAVRKRLDRALARLARHPEFRDL